MADGEFEVLSPDTPTKKDDSLASLEAKLVEEKDARKEERFVWIVITIILGDCIMFMNMANPTAPVVILTLELVLLVILAKRLGIEKTEALALFRKEPSGPPQYRTES